MSDRDEWRQTRREIDRATIFGLSRGTFIVIAVALLVGLIGAGTWALKVATSDIKGRGDSVVKINEADNRLFQQGDFNRRFQGILTADKNVDAAYQAQKANPEDRTLQVNYTGAVQHCNDLVGQYNSKAREIIAEKFRDEDLPYEIDSADPKTDCKENSR